VSEPTLGRWLEEFIAGGKDRLAGKIDKGQKSEIARLEREIEERNRVIGEITIANTILKKRL
jgi:hypothetical protein